MSSRIAWCLWGFSQHSVIREDAKDFRGCAARMNFLSQDCPELQHGAKEVCREMAKPLVGSWKRVKKMVRFILSRESVVWRYEWQDEVKEMDVYSDNDWGGRVGGKKSTSGGCVMLGRHCIKTWSSTQGAVALSSAEAEFYAMIEGVLRGKGLLSLARELGFEDVSQVINVFTDSAAAKSFVNRRGLGKMKHIEIRDLWLQQEVLKGSVKVFKVRGVENPADLMTKVLSKSEIIERLERISIQWM